MLRNILLGITTSLCFMAALAQAQTSTTGQISGVVTDPSGATVAAVSLTASDSAGVERTVSSDEQGHYTFPLLPPGTYKVEAGRTGFAKATFENVTVRITEITTLNVPLTVATQKQSINVTTEPPMLQTETPARGDVIQSREIRQLPLATRNFQQLLTLTPGTSAAIPNSSDLGRGDTAFNVNGNRALSNAVVINGVDASSIGTGSTPNLAVPATDTLQEFIVQTNLYDASQGRNAGSVVAAVTRSGTNEFHGDLYEFLRNTDLNANNFFLNRAGVSRPPYHRNQFGGTLGGPVVKDRAWFFVSYQGTREVNATSLVNSIGTVFVPADLSNDRSTATLNQLAASYGMPSCTSPLAALGCLSPTATTLLQAKLAKGQYIIPSAPHPIPIPTTGGPAPYVSVPVVGTSTFREDQFNTNFDVKLTDSNRLSFKFFWADNPELQALYNSFGLGNALPVPGFGATTNFNQRVLSADDIHIFTPSLVNDLRFGWTSITTTSTPQEPFTSSQLGIASPLSNLFSGMPEISVANDFDLGASPFSDNSASEPTYTASETLSWTKGRHSLKFGAQYAHYELQENFNLYTRGQIFFLGYSGDPFKDFLGGYYDTAGLTIMGSGVNNRDVLSYDLAGFATDDWRVTNHLTLNLGVRYEYFSPFTEAQGRYVGIDQDAIKTLTIPGAPVGDNTAIVGGFVQAGNATHPLPGVPLVQSSVVPPDKNNFAPRFGFAWQPSDNAHLVVRGGYGIYYDHPNSRFINNQILNFPYYTLAQAFFTPISNPFVQVPPPSAYPLTFNNSAVFPFGGPPAFLPATSLLGSVQAIPANGIFPDIHDFRTPYVQQFSFGVQDEFANNWLTDISYVGSLGRKLLQLVDINQEYGPSTPTAAPLSPGLSSLPLQGFGVHLMQSSADSSYNALQASLTKRFSHGLQFLASYTYSHSIDDYSGDPTGTSDVTVVPGNEMVLNNRASSDFDRRQRFVFSGFYELPHFYKSHGFGNQILNGWQIASIFTIQSGTPFSVLTNDTAFVEARADVNPALPCNGMMSGSTISRLNNYFNTSCFTPATAIGDFGNTGRNILVGPGQRDVDLSILKFFPVTEKSYFQFRTEFFNAFNNVSFANPVNVLASSSAGAIVATTTGPRVIQFALKFDF